MHAAHAPAAILPARRFAQDCCRPLRARQLASCAPCGPGLTLSLWWRVEGSRVLTTQEWRGCWPRSALAIGHPLLSYDRLPLVRWPVCLFGPDLHAQCCAHQSRWPVLVRSSVCAWRTRAWCRWCLLSHFCAVEPRCVPQVRHGTACGRMMYDCCAHIPPRKFHSAHIAPLCGVAAAALCLRRRGCSRDGGLISCERRPVSCSSSRPTVYASGIAVASRSQT